MQKRFLDAGFSPDDVHLLGPDPRKQNLVVRYRADGAPAEKPVLFLCHIDVVQALRSDWHTDPFEFVEKDGYYYGRGTQDMKDSDAALVATFLRLHREGYKPQRDLILALTADEEGRQVQWRQLAGAAASRPGRRGLRHQSRRGRRGAGPWARRGGRCRSDREGLFRLPDHGGQSRRAQFAAPARQRHLRADRGAQQAGRLLVSIRTERGDAHLLQESRRAGNGPDRRGHARHPGHAARPGCRRAAERRAQLQLQLPHHLRGHAPRRPATPTTRCRRPRRPT